ncbi:MAG: DUF5723 family protein [Paludibacter sp.]|nr:DUF5723 family protein [Paludibacter sp.]
MKNHIKKSIFLWSVFICTLSISAQQINTLYFMENVPVRHYLNPAFQPSSNFYLGLPLLGNTQFGLGNNSLTLKNLIYNDELGNTISFLHPNGNKELFLAALKNTTSLETDLHVNLFSVGFRAGKSYLSVSLTEKIDGQLGIPKDFLKLLLVGTPDTASPNIYKLGSLGFDLNAYTEAALGYSLELTDSWSFGVKLKFLYGTANVSLANQYLDLKADIDEWFIGGKGMMNASLPGDLQIGDNLNSISYIQPTSIDDWISPNGIGAGIDLGIAFKPIKNLTVSTAITDLGMINWNKNVNNIAYSLNYKFNGLGSFTGSDLEKMDADSVATSMLNALRDSALVSGTNNAYSTYTSPKLNIGVEFGVFNNKLSIGLLSRTMYQRKILYEELTASLNFRPADWFNMSVSYSVLNGRMSNIGAGLGLRTGFIHWFVAADYVPIHYAPLALNSQDANQSGFTAPIPYNTKGMNFAFGVNFVVGKK